MGRERLICRRQDIASHRWTHRSGQSHGNGWTHRLRWTHRGRWTHREVSPFKIGVLYNKQIRTGAVTFGHIILINEWTKVLLLRVITHCRGWIITLYIFLWLMTNATWEQCSQGLGCHCLACSHVNLFVLTWYCMSPVRLYIPQWDFICPLWDCMCPSETLYVPNETLHVLNETIRSKWNLVCSQWDFICSQFVYPSLKCFY